MSASSNNAVPHEPSHEPISDGEGEAVHQQYAFGREMNEIAIEEHDDTHVESDHGAADVEVEHEGSSSDEDRPEPSVYSGMEVNPSFAALPRHLKNLAKEIRRLDPTDLLTISEMTQRITSRELYSLLPYTGSNWYLPEIRTVGDDERRWSVGYDARRGVELTLAGRCLTFHIGAWLLRASIMVLFWYMLYNVLGSTLMTRGGYVWDPLVTFVVSAVVGGTVCRLAQVPPLLGVLWIAIMWANIGPEVGYLTSGIYKDVSKIAQRIGLTVVLMRAGFSLSLKSIRPHLRESMLLALLPYGFELTVHSLVAKEIFGYESYTWAFLQGCLCSTVSPAIVVPGVLYLQDQGYGKGNGPLSLMMSAVGLEVCLGVWASNFIIGLLFDSTPIAQAIVLGPVQIVGGMLLGVLVGLGFYYLVEMLKREADRMPNGKYATDHIDGVMNIAFAVFLFFSIGFVFFGYAHKLAGGGAVMTVFFAATVAHMWIKDNNKELMAQKTNFGLKLAASWDLVVMVALFSMVGVGVTLSKIFNSAFFPKAIAVVAASTAARVLVIYCVQYSSPHNWKEKLLVCGGYIGKATAQAAVGPVALSLITSEISSQGLTPDRAVKLENAENVANIAILYILVCAPIASLTMTKLGPRILDRDMAHR